MLTIGPSGSGARAATSPSQCPPAPSLITVRPSVAVGRTPHEPSSTGTGFRRARRGLFGYADEGGPVERQVEPFTARLGEQQARVTGGQVHAVHARPVDSMQTGSAVHHRARRMPLARVGRSGPCRSVRPGRRGCRRCRRSRCRRGCRPGLARRRRARAGRPPDTRTSGTSRRRGREPASGARATRGETSSPGRERVAADARLRSHEQALTSTGRSRCQPRPRGGRSSSGGRPPRPGPRSPEARAGARSRSAVRR